MNTKLITSGSILAAGWIAAEVVIWFLYRKLSQRLNADIRLGSFTLVSRHQMLSSANIVRLCLVWLGRFVAVLLAVQILCLAYPQSEAWARIAQGWLAAKGIQVGLALLNYLPSLLTIIGAAWLSRAALNLNRRLFSAIDSGGLSLAGFDRRWAGPTRQLLGALILITAASTILPLLPGAASPVFRGASVLVGVLLSLGSGPAMTNIVSGFLLTYSNAFQVGDVVEVQSYLGKIKERNLLVTRLRTFKNQDVTLPNSSVMSSNIINFSNAAHEGSLIATSIVTLGYEVDPAKVEEILLQASQAAEGWTLSPAPFVLNHGLDGSWVGYELNVYLCEINDWLGLQSALRKHVLNAFHQAGVELMTPSLHGIRDAQLPTIPAGLSSHPLVSTSFKVDVTTQN
jgi:small-conductance mechanosensitive channel